MFNSCCFFFLTDFTKQIGNYTRTFMGSITKKMACCLSKIMSSSIIDVLDYTPKDSSFEYLRPRGQIIVQIDEKVKVPVLILDFENCPTKFVCLWPHNPVQKNQFLDLDRTLLSSPEVFSSNDSGYGSGYDTVF